MNGAESIIASALASGVEVCFANPGTTELPLVAALDSVREGGRTMRAILGLFEGVCTGAADGYARMADRPALTLVHLGPGFANGIANLHNARRARSPVVNVIGDQATWHREFDAPLTSDIESLARPVSGWIRSIRESKQAAGATAEAIAAAGRMPGQVATLIVPSDCQWNSADGPAPPAARSTLPPIAPDAVDHAAAILRRGAPVALMLGGLALREGGLAAAGRIAASTGCRLICETFFARLEHGAGLPAIERLPYFPDQALKMLSTYRAVVLAGVGDPVAFFGYPNVPSKLIPDGIETATLAGPMQDAAAALEALAHALGAGVSAGGARTAVSRPARPTGALTPPAIAAAIVALMPERAIVMDESATTGGSFFAAAATAPRFTYLSLTGGAIGQGLPAATGAAVACPDRRVIAFQADGSAMYTAQALWTQAREQLDVTTILCNNRSYRILQVELARAGIAEPGRSARSLTDLANPEINWTSIARGLGVPAVRVESADALVKELERALAARGPNLIEMML